MVNAIKEMKAENSQQNNSHGVGMNSSKEQKGIETAFGGTIPIADTTIEDEVEDDVGFQTIMSKKSRRLSSARTGNQNISKRNQNAMDDSSNVSLVVFGLNRNITDALRTGHLAHNNVKVKSCELLTKYENARTLAYKIRVNRKDAAHIQKLEIWTEGSGVRPYTIPNPQKTGNFNRITNKNSKNNTGFTNLNGGNSNEFFDRNPYVENINPRVYDGGQLMRRVPITSNKITSRMPSIQQPPRLWNTDGVADIYPNQQNMHVGNPRYQYEQNFPSIGQDQVMLPRIPRNVGFVNRLGVDDFIISNQNDEL